MSAYVAGVQAAPSNKFQMAIYTNSGSAPGVLVSSTTEGTLTANSWNSLPIAATLTACDRAETAPAAAGAAPPATGAPAPAGEVVCATAPLRLRVVGVRQETPDSIRVELALTNAASREGWTPTSPVAVSVEAAVEALEGLSVMTTEGRRRVFPLRAEAGPRVGPRAELPPPGQALGSARPR